MYYTQGGHLYYDEVIFNGEENSIIESSRRKQGTQEI